MCFKIKTSNRPPSARRPLACARDGPKTRYLRRRHRRGPPGSSRVRGSRAELCIACCRRRHHMGVVLAGCHKVLRGAAGLPALEPAACAPASRNAPCGCRCLRARGCRNTRRGCGRRCSGGGGLAVQRTRRPRAAHCALPHVSHAAAAASRELRGPQHAMEHGRGASARGPLRRGGRSLISRRGISGTMPGCARSRKRQLQLSVLNSRAQCFPRRLGGGGWVGGVPLLTTTRAPAPCRPDRAPCPRRSLLCYPRVPNC